ncbi:MAG TPA: HAD-IG family 5'-nucleotidase [Polyangiaceae bacterium]|nr:HAD-IG family 5'-nucleotidase [Polyangiaceae bacterium]
MTHDPVGPSVDELPLPIEGQLPLPLPGLIEPPPPGVSIPRADRIYANRNLRLGAIEWIGFDMDYTLAIYRQEAMDALSVELTVEKLIERGYPASLRDLRFDTRFPIRGLLVDKQLGNVLKMDRHKEVYKGYHGTRLLERAEIVQLYHETKLEPHTARYHWIDTLFALCEVTSYSALVSALEEKGESFDPEKLFHDVRSAIDASHADGSVYARVTADPARYLDLDPNLPRTLHKLRSAGKKLFVLTNSPWSYTNTVMSYLLDGGQDQYTNWQQYFDVVICSAKKPRWFAAGTPFEERTATGLKPAVGGFERGHVYEGGSLREFEVRADLEGTRVLYVGDHIYGDILRSRKDSTWRTALVIQELDQEIEALEASASLRLRRRQLAEARPLYEDQLRYYQHQYKALSRLGSSTDVAAAREGAKDEIDRLRAELSRLEHEYEDLNVRNDLIFHPYWGALLKEMNGLSIFGQQVELYADVYMRRVSCLSAYAPTQFFRSPHDLMPHEI